MSVYSGGYRRWEELRKSYLPLFAETFDANSGIKIQEGYFSGRSRWMASFVRVAAV